jgi:hypothetical protein
LTEHGNANHPHRVRGHQVVLDIGGDRGALLIFTASRRAGEEIVVCSRGEPGRHIHSQVHPRFVGSTTVYAAVYPELVAGDYVFCCETGDRGSLTITGGVVTELDWRSIP